MKKPIRILIVDDDRFINKVLQELFRKNGFEVECAFDGQDCLRKVSEFRPALVLMDVMMPNENGYRVSRLIKSLAKVSRWTLAPKIMLMTARRLDGDPEREEMFRQFSMADALVYKPFEFPDLLGHVQLLAGLQDMQQTVLREKEAL